MKIKFFLWMTTALSLFATHTVNFDALSMEQAKENRHLLSLKGEVIQIRGFWYPLSNEEGILASHPELKSCCLRAPTKIDNQVIVKGDNLALLQPQRALTLEGVFNIAPAYNEKGELVQLFVLEQSREVPRLNGDMKWVFALVFFFLLALGINSWKKNHVFKS